MKIIGAALISFSSWAGLTLIFAFLDWIGRDVPGRLSLFHYVMEVVPWTTAIALIVMAFITGMGLVDNK